jgi:hypothetical protein
MKLRYKHFNPKRRLQNADDTAKPRLDDLARRVSYGGNPEHKRNPGDFGLSPPSDPRQAKSLCDVAKIFNREDALGLLRQGITRGLISDREEQGWPKNVWSVTSDGIPLEAQLENSQTGRYHGYPMPESDPLASEVIQRWGQYG